MVKQVNHLKNCKISTSKRCSAHIPTINSLEASPHLGMNLIRKIIKLCTKTICYSPRLWWQRQIPPVVQAEFGDEPKSWLRCRALPWRHYKVKRILKLELKKSWWGLHEAAEQKKWIDERKRCIPSLPRISAAVLLIGSSVAIGFGLLWH